MILLTLAAALPSLSVPTSAQCPEGGSVGVTVTRSGAKTTTASFRYATADGTAKAPADYTAINGQQSVRKNAMTYTLTLRCGADDKTYRGDRSFTFTIAPLTGVTVSQGRTVVTVRENDPVPPPVVPPMPTGPVTGWVPAPLTVGGFACDKAKLGTANVPPCGAGVVVRITGSGMSADAVPVPLYASQFFQDLSGQFPVKSPSAVGATSVWPASDLQGIAPAH